MYNLRSLITGSFNPWACFLICKMEILVHISQDWLKNKFKNLKLPFKFPFMCNLMMYIHIQGFPDGSNGRVCLQCRRPGFNPWVGKMPWRRKWQPTPVFLPGGPHGQRSLAGYSPWDCTESEMTKHVQAHVCTHRCAHTHTHTHTHCMTTQVSLCAL